MNKTLETKNMILTPIQVSDAEAIFHFFTHQITKYMYPKPANTIDDTLAFINHSIALRNENKELVFVARLKYDDTFVGCFGLHQLDTQSPELGVWIQEDLHHKHLGLEGVSRLIEYARDNIPHDYLIYPVDRRNYASRNIPESYGGILKKTYQKIGRGQNELDIIEYWIYPKMPLDYVYPTILFQGDSITDCGRNRLHIDSLGDGYVQKLKQHFPGAKLINKGISGDRTEELLKRWDDDVIKQKPDILVLLCGVNDVWHYYNFGKAIDEKSFKDNYEKLIKETMHQLPQTKILLLEPFAYPIYEFHENWKPLLDAFISIIRELAKKYQLPLIPLSDQMKQWQKQYAMEAILGDGVHPTELGHELIAKTIKPILRDMCLTIQEENLKK
ncbi:MAG: GNAT family N-acetyltransferase [Acholeplasmataceae bacterium]|jgi:lysophospholipase L1-like esterase/RimJ/RimL family protein N-acetyltransferase|nr:GNAT family N-acetyltransferase [Acholeplasmataceae bacterium]